jgi:hypothetical protein
MAHLPLLSHSFPPITSAAFREDHITLTGPLMRLMCTSGRVRDLLSAVPAMTFESHWMENGVCTDRSSPFLNPSPSCSPCLHPPFLSGLKECIIRLEDGDWCLRTDPILCPLDRRRVTLTRLVQSLASCPLLSSLSLSMGYLTVPGEADDSPIIDQLQTFPSLRTLILSGLKCDQQSLSLLLSLPLHHLDILNLCFHRTQRDAVYPCSLTLHTLRTPWWNSFTSLLHPYSQLTEEGSGLRYFEVGWGDEDDDGLLAFVRSCRSLTALGLPRKWEMEWPPASLLVDPTVTTPSSQGLCLPRLQHLAYVEKGDRPGDRLTVLQCFRWFGPQLLTLNLELSSSHSLREVLLCCMEQCRQLRTWEVYQEGELDVERQWDADGDEE